MATKRLQSFLLFEPVTVVSLLLLLMITACGPTSSSNIKNNETQTQKENVTGTVTNNLAEHATLENISVAPEMEVTTNNKKSVLVESDTKQEVLNYASEQNSDDITMVIHQNNKTMRQRGETAVSEQNVFYDKSNDAYDILQKANESLADFPVNRVGEVDWMMALNQNLIDPRISMTGNDKKTLKDNDIIMKNTKEMSYVRFPHKTHTYWLDCSNCHDKIFTAEVNSNPINMDKIFRGEYCGVCHNKVAFTTYMCEMCHSVN